MKHSRRKFAEHFFKTGNATRSAIAAGYSPKRADQAGYTLLRYPEVQAYLDKLNRKSLGDFDITIAERKALLAKLATQLGNHNPADYMVDGEPRISKEMPNPMAIQAIKRRREPTRDGQEITTTDIRFRDPSIAIKAIDTLNRMEGIYRDEAGGAGTLVQMVVISADGQSQVNIGPASPAPDHPVIDVDPEGNPT